MIENLDDRTHHIMIALEGLTTMEAIGLLTSTAITLNTIKTHSPTLEALK